MKSTIGTWVLITGASSGLGEEFARQYAQRGHRLLLVARRLDRLEALAAMLRQQHNIEVVVEQADLSDITAVKNLHRRVSERGIQVDVLINNAGHGTQGPFLDASLDSALSMLQVDIVSLTALTHLFGGDMRARGYGQILQVASVLSYLGVKNFAVYSAAKAYVLRFGEALHQEFKADGVTVTTLCPGITDTGFASAGQMRVTPMMRALMMPTSPVVSKAIRALDAGRISVVTGIGNRMTVAFMWATPRRVHQALLRRMMSV